MNANRNLIRATAVVLMATLNGLASAATLSVNFESTPALPTGPSIYSGQTPQTVDIPGLVSFSGGIVMGNITNFPQESHASTPNLYFTTSGNNGASPLAPITIDIDPTFPVTGISGTLFNGGLGARHYTITGFSGASIVATQHIDDLPLFGFATFSLTSEHLSRVTISDSSALWNFMIDDVTFAFVPEPTGLLLGGVGLLAFVRCAWKRRSKTRGQFVVGSL